MKRLSLRWKLILTSGALALLTMLILGVMLHARGQRQLLSQLEKSLETKCDEVITVIENPDLHPSLADFLIIETAYRFTPYTYYYQLRDATGRSLVRSQNLLERDLPLPADWRHDDRARDVHIATTPSIFRGSDEPIRIRTERISIDSDGRYASPLIIQTAVSLGPFMAAARKTLIDATVVSTSTLAVVFLLLWFVTSAALKPVAAMTRKASQITGSNLRERLPSAGRGDELDELANVLNDMLDKVAGSLHQMEQFSSDAAHQLRTPLTRIRGEIDLILRAGMPGSLRAELERIQGEVDRLSRMCSRLLLLGRLDLQRVEASHLGETVDLAEVVEELVEQLMPLAGERGIHLGVAKTTRAAVSGNRMLLVEALLNLLDNALCCTPRGGSVAVALVDNGREVQVSVEDTGPGIPQEDRERIFQPFQRLSQRATGPDQGHGLGLAIVRSIARAHGGRVQLGDGPGQGSVFSIVLPRRAAAI